MASCWCGNESLTYFSPDYLKCQACESLVLAIMPDPSELQVIDDEHDFYGRSYYESHLTNHYGYPGLNQRARSDLAERCLHWLRTVLKYELPPGKVLELGSAHGGFVAMLRWAGYDATGLELSPWIVDFAHNTFDAPMLLGSIEDQSIEPGSLDIIALMDVLEHLPQPSETMQHCLNLLKPDGIIILQTPRYPENTTYPQLVETRHPFLMQLKAREHLYLFSSPAIREFFHRLNADYLTFEPAIFTQYDMFLVVGRKPFTSNAAEAIEQSLAHTVNGRMVQALLDIDEQRQVTQQKWQEAEADREARLKILKQQGEKLGLLEADRAERLAVIESLGGQLGKVESERNDAQAQLADLRKHIDNLTTDYAARLAVIEEQGKQLGITEAERNDARAELDDLRRQFDDVEADRAARLRVIEEQGRQLGTIEAERNEARAELNELRRQFDAVEADRAARLRVIEDLGQQAEAAKAVSQKQAEETERLRQQLNDLRSRWPVRALQRLRFIKGPKHPSSTPPQ